MSVKTDAEQLDIERRAEIDRMIVYLSLAEKMDWNVPDVTYFDGAIPGLANQMTFIDRCLRMKHHDMGGNERIDAELNAARGARGAAILTGTGGDLYHVVGGRELRYHEKKVRAPLLSINLDRPLSAFNDRIIEVRSVAITERGTAHSLARLDYYQRNGKWYPSHSERRKIEGKNCSHETLSMGLIACCSAANSMLWRVSIRLQPNMPSVGLFSDPTGIREFFRFRELSPGQSRRSALLHWVTEHWRQDRTDPDAERYVREHLRGRREFEWGGMHAAISIPQSEEERVVAAAERRNQLVGAGLNKRQREALKYLL